MGTFDGIQIGSTGLQAQRRGVDLAGQNIANVNTPGYSRQRLAITADAGPVTPAIHSTWDGSGLGVRSVEVSRMRDRFLDRRAMEEGTRHAELTELADTLSSIESVFGEPGDTALSSAIADFTAAWDDVANRPDDLAARAQLVEQARTLTARIGQTERDLAALADLKRSETEALVAEVNTRSQQVASMQDSIKNALAAGIDANELLDQRDALVEEIADAVGGTVHHLDDGTVSVFVGGVALVRGNQAYQLTAYSAGGAMEIRSAADGSIAPVGGAAKGLLGAVNDVVPRYQADMVAFRDGVRDQVNGLHTTGYDLDGNAGVAFFVDTPDGLAVNGAILADSRLVAAAASPGTLDGSIAQRIADLDTLDTDYRQTVVSLGVESQSAARRVRMQEAVVNQVDAEREAVSGVNLDEELTDLVRFQRAYEANARFISAVDDLLSTLINGTGRVGR